MQTTPNIDVVITYVDGNDEAWLSKRAQYTPGISTDANPNRYRDFENLKYIFRGIDKYMPWVRKVFLVTDHQAPQWLDSNCDKLVLINHEDYIPADCLPTFNTNVIENYFHRIPGLSEYFISFNDDMFVLDKMRAEDFFEDGCIKGTFMEYPVGCSGRSDIFPVLLTNNNVMLARHFSRSEYKKRLRKKILSPKYGKFFFYNAIMYALPFPSLFGMLTPHFPRPHLKGTLEKIWSMEPEVMEQTSHHRFRSKDDITVFAFYMYDMLSGQFKPSNFMNLGRMMVCGRDDVKDICKVIESRKCSLLCLNDECSEAEFESVRDSINQAFDRIFPDKSCFER